MMNFDIKKKINTLRDILVGKVPDPKAQVEQITIALIYKFMDDMDLQGSEFGGSRVFFIGEYEKYAFSQIMLSEHTAQERLNLYAEGMDKMTTNPELPQLFREILRNTYIPYRDPETLNRFLKEISEFSYEDSEDLGNAFEYLLSIMGSQGDAGQFRTPRHIIDMMVEIMAPQKNESILDPACGTAGFLISAYNFIKKSNLDGQGKSTLSADDKNRMIENFAGYDISPDMVRLSRVNMYLHGFTTPHISEYDTLTSMEKWDDTYDVIFANPPFMTPKGGIIPHNRYRVSAKRAEVLFVDYIAEHLNSTGRAAIIVPEGIVFQSQTAYKELRKILVDDGYLYGVISLPAGVFNPYSGVKTSILLIDCTLAKEKDSILFVKLNNDGYDLGAQRREIKGSEIPDVINVFKDYQGGVNIEGRENVVLVTKEDIAGQDYILVGERYKTPQITNSHWPIAKIGDICITSSGGTPSSSVQEYYENGTIRWLKSGEVSGYIYDSEIKITELGLKNSSAKIFPIDTVLIAMYGATAGQVGLLKVPCATNQAVCGIYPNERFLPEYLYYYLKEQRKYFISLSTGGAQPNISQSIIKNVNIPVPSLSTQQEIVEEIERYQKLIDGARQIVENYKPIIKIEPEWVTVPLGDLCEEIQNGANVEQLDEMGKYRVTRIQTISDGTVDLSKTKWTNDEPGKNYFMQKGDILLSHINSYEQLAKTAFFPDVEEKVVHGINLIKCRLKKDIILPEFAIIYMKSDRFVAEAKRYAQRAVNQASIKITDLKRIEIPVPTMDVQEKVVAEIAAEVATVKGTRRLIEIFQQKIEDKIAEVWRE